MPTLPGRDRKYSATSRKTFPGRSRQASLLANPEHPRSNSQQRSRDSSRQRTPSTDRKSKGKNRPSADSRTPKRKRSHATPQILPSAPLPHNFELLRTPTEEEKEKEGELGSPKAALLSMLQ